MFNNITAKQLTPFMFMTTLHDTPVNKLSTFTNEVMEMIVEKMILLNKME